jgi:hypothetical protein
MRDVVTELANAIAIIRVYAWHTFCRKTCNISNIFTLLRTRWELNWRVKISRDVLKQTLWNLERREQAVLPALSNASFLALMLGSDFDRDSDLFDLLAGEGGVDFLEYGNSDSESGSFDTTVDRDSDDGGRDDNAWSDSENDDEIKDGSDSHDNAGDGSNNRPDHRDRDDVAQDLSFIRSDPRAVTRSRDNGAWQRKNLDVDYMTYRGNREEDARDSDSGFYYRVAPRNQGNNFRRRSNIGVEYRAMRRNGDDDAGGRQQRWIRA